MIEKIIKYGADWCGPCKATSMALKETGIPFGEVNVDENPEVIEEKNIRTIPVIEFYEEGNEVPVKVHYGGLTKEKILEICKELS